MDGRLLFKNCSLFRTDGRVRDGMAVLVDEGVIKKVAPDSELTALPGDWVVDCRGRLVAPALVDCHTHLVGGQLLPPSGPHLVRSRASRRAQLQVLSATLTASEVGALSAFALGRSLLSGVTTCVEHLDGAADVRGALEAQAVVASVLGSRLVCSTGLSSTEAIDASVDFVEAHRTHPLVRGALGFFSSSTLEDASLFRLGRLREELGAGAVFHLAEDEDDLAATYVQSGRRIVARLESAGMLGAGVVGAFGHALDRADTERLARSRTLTALSPRSGMFEEPQPSGLEALLSNASLLGLGSAGTGSIWDDIVTCYAELLSVARAGRLLDPDGQLSEIVVDGPAELVSMLFGVQGGAIEEGRTADLVVFQHLAAERDHGLLPSALLVQLSRARVEWVVSAGRVVVREGQLLGHDLLELEREAGKALASVRRRAGAEAA